MFLGSGVLEDQNSVLVEALSYLLAFDFPPGKTVKVGLHINHRDLVE
jgi:hypothetical protein